MALSTCLYCGASVSESASICPQCKQARPTDQEHMRAEETRRAEKEAMAEKARAISEFLRQSTVPCKDCGNPLPLASLVTYGRAQACGRCGCTSNHPRCAFCEELAGSIEIIDDRFLPVCLGHTLEKCHLCKKMVFHNSLKSIEVFCRGIGGHPYLWYSSCPKCRGLTARVRRALSKHLRWK